MKSNENIEVKTFTMKNAIIGRSGEVPRLEYKASEECTQALDRWYKEAHDYVRLNTLNAITGVVELYNGDLLLGQSHKLVFTAASAALMLDGVRRTTKGAVRLFNLIPKMKEDRMEVRSGKSGK